MNERRVSSEQFEHEWEKSAQFLPFLMPMIAMSDYGPQADCPLSGDQTGKADVERALQTNDRFRPSTVQMSEIAARRRRSCKPIQPNPDTNIAQTPGSGTPRGTPGPPPPPPPIPPE